MIKRFFHIATLILLIFFNTNSSAQNTTNTSPDTTSLWHFDTRLVQFSGVIVTADSLVPLPFATVYDLSTKRGTITDYYGFFSFVAMKGDTIRFSYTGMKPVTFVIPDSLSTNRYSLIQMMHADTTWLPTTVIYPWPSKEMFAQAFVNLELPDDYVTRAERNMQLAELRERAYAVHNDGEMAYRQTMMNERYKLYYAGQLPPNNLLNPVAWYKFVEAWKNGDFKRTE